MSRFIAFFHRLDQAMITAPVSLLALCAFLAGLGLVFGISLIAKVL